MGGPLARIAGALVGRAEARLGVPLDYVRHIAAVDLRLLRRYARVFGFLDPNRAAPADAYHAARLRAALAADCGTCLEAETNLARRAGMDGAAIAAVVKGEAADPLAAVIALTDAVIARREDDPGAREAIRDAYGEAALVELSFAMTGAALLPGIKRALGYATTCDPGAMRRALGEPS